MIRMGTIKAWLAAHSISSQSVAAVWVMATVLYNTNPDFAAYCGLIYRGIPRGLHSFIVGIVIPIAIFWRTTHSTKVSAEIEDGAPGVVKASASATTTDLPAPPK
jgi:hypothetical protein